MTSMDATRHWDAYCRAVFEYTLDEVERLSNQFGESLQEWCEQFFYYRPITWREELGQFIRWWADVGIIVQPQSVQAIETLFESRLNLIGPFAVEDGRLRSPNATPTGRRLVVNVVPSVSGPPESSGLNTLTPGDVAGGAALAGVLRNAGDRATQAVKTRVPRTGGTWIQGQPGHGIWKPDKPILLPDGTKVGAVPFRDGLPVFDEWSKGHVTIAMTGDPVFDKAQAIKVWTATEGDLLEEYAFHHDGRFTRVLTEEGKTVFVGRMHVVPKVLNEEVPHIGSASSARVLKVGRKLAAKLNTLAMEGKGPVVKAAKGFTKVATKLAKKAGKVIPFVGTVLAIIDFGENVEAHGVRGAIVRALPVIGSVVTAYDIGSEASDHIRGNAAASRDESYRAVNDPVDKAHREAAEDTANALEEINQRLKDVKPGPQPDELVEAIKEPVNEFYETMLIIYSRLFRGLDLPYPADINVDPATNEGSFELRLRLAKEKLEKEIRDALLGPHSSEQPIEPSGPLL
jgi:hypothetical protein